LAVWWIPSEFTACSRDSKWCTTAYWATESAGKIGTVIVLAVSCFFYTIRIESKKQKLKVFLKSFLVLGGLLSGIAFINEHVTKEVMGIPRPSHIFIAQNALPMISVDSIYKIGEEGRKKLLRSMIQSDSVRFGAIDIRIQDHWVEEAGYSFPSGHSFNAFLLATILTFSMYHSRSKITRSLYLIPLFWALLVAVSRVAVGAHSALDVSFGAALGLVVGHLFLYVDYTRELITKRE
jgi:phosphatidylglycerophosphatase B